MRRGMQWLILLPALVLVPYGSPPVAGAHGPSPYWTEVRAHGVALSLSLARRSYSQGALVRVMVRLTNISAKAVQVGGEGGPACGRRGPGVRVMDAANRVLYPPAINWPLASCGPHILPRPLRPGGVMQGRLFAILQGARIQAVASVGRNPIEVATPPLTVTLVPEPAPHISLTTTTPSEIEIAPATPEQRGSFYLVAGILCLTQSGGEGSGFTRFRGPAVVDRDGVFRLPADCEPPTHWSFAGGWLNHPAVTVDHVQPISPSTP